MSVWLPVQGRDFVIRHRFPPPHDLPVAPPHPENPPPPPPTPLPHTPSRGTSTYSFTTRRDRQINSNLTATPSQLPETDKLLTSPNSLSPPAAAATPTLLNQKPRLRTVGVHSRDGPCRPTSPPPGLSSIHTAPTPPPDPAPRLLAIKAASINQLLHLSLKHSRYLRLSATGCGFCRCAVTHIDDDDGCLLAALLASYSRRRPVQ